ncbi:hypothetical protein C1I98_18320 [Spongiactinospora gelatinilytica]|uniref:Uncharacterized protein n=1 Tax=Spongiactinospora gelatinilytica TaxID=2666298 RepID=A0A2W2HY37_9ACTN|nr:Rv3235 family protein [Spongiactinospora gelatinilytica]PZG43484.1 hypothetical protein C1I98_18320 [Spongiactinospora gelatinilytica]
MQRLFHAPFLPTFSPSPVADPPYDATAGKPSPAPDPEPVPTPEPMEVPMRDSYVSPVPADPDEQRIRALGLAFAEVLAGQRPPTTVAQHVTDRTYGELVRAGKIIEADGPVRVSAPHISRTNASVLEMCLLVHCGSRSRVLAMRLERRGAHWRCTEFETTR